ncbi:MAG TPA: dihydroorotate dehydrogenase electron transfer subunit, partial [Thermodesulfobacteriota bacterium]|nr:dihydroorotate dehydrogenase electron transfer subunit [Thermodesulfobacteriota bacterium]
MNPREIKARVLLHRRISADLFRLRLLCPEVARLASPGQFVMLRVHALQEPFLRRPFSFSRIFPARKPRKTPLAEGGVEICYRVVGRGTSLLAQTAEGQRLDILGPLGNGFWREEGRDRCILVGGGIGIAPLIAWAEELGGAAAGKKRARREGAKDVLFIMGGKSRDQIVGLPEARKMGFEAEVSTEDGSLGARGMATDLLERELLEGHTASTALYACGPPAMLARVAQMADQFDLPCQVLLESRMACGVGACLGCTVKLREEAGASGRGETRNGAEEAPSETAGECGAGPR